MSNAILSLRPMRILLALLVVASATLFSSCGNADDNPKPMGENIVQVIEGDARFSILLAAITKTDLATTLSGVGPFTVFAPTNDAFGKMRFPFNSAVSIAAIPAGSPDITALRGILQYHVVAGDITTNDIANGASSRKTVRQAASTTINDNTIYFTKNSSGVFVNGSAKVVVADIDASNGQIHAIDNVLGPPSLSAVQIVLANSTASTPEFTLLHQALERPAAASIRATASNQTANITVFAPTDAAFRTLLNGAALSSVSDATLVAILSRHVVTSGRVFSSDLAAGPITTAAGANTVTVATSGMGFTLRGGTGTAANITAPNILATNGVVHIIDQVLLP